MPDEEAPMHVNQLRAELRDMRRFSVPPSLATPKKVLVNCHYCGYAPEGEIPLAGACPKCGGSSWERFALSMRLVPPEMGGLRKEQA